MSAPETPPARPVHGPRDDFDRWMDTDRAGGRSPRLSIFAPALALPRRFTEFVSTSPGLLWVVSTVLVLAILAAGGAMAASSQSRQADLNKLVNGTEPLSYASQELFNSLSVADSVATTSFIQDGAGTGADDAAYTHALQNATQSVIRAANGIEDPSSRDMRLVLEIQQKLPDYVSLIAEAKVNNRVSNPVGGAYIAQASELMQNDLLTAASELYTRTNARVGEQQVGLTRPMWFPLSGLLAAVVMLVLAQFRLAALTNRRLNAGYGTATILMTLALLWTVGSAVVTWHAGANGLTRAAEPLETLTSVRIEAQQTRTTEALSLVRREYSDAERTSFSEHIRSIDAALDDLRDTVHDPALVDSSRELLRGWDTSHARTLTLIRDGDYPAAIRVAVAEGNGATGPDDATDPAGTAADPGAAGTTGATGTTRNFARLDRQLQQLIAETRKDLRDYLIESRVSAERVTNLVVVFTVFSALCVILGTRPRLQEYM